MDNIMKFIYLIVIIFLLILSGHYLIDNYQKNKSILKWIKKVKCGEYYLAGYLSGYSKNKKEIPMGIIEKAVKESDAYCKGKV